MLTENRFYNYDDALAGIVDHLAKTPTGQIRNLSLLITDGSRPVASYDPEKQKYVKESLNNLSHITVASKRLTMLQDAFNFHVYGSERLGMLHFTVVIDSLVAGTAAGMLHVIHDTLRRICESKGCDFGTVYLFAVEASV